MLYLLESELRLIEKERGVRSYKIMSKDELINAINTSEPAKKKKKKIEKTF